MSQIKNTQNPNKVKPTQFKQTNIDKTKLKCQCGKPNLQCLPFGESGPVVDIPSDESVNLKRQKRIFPHLYVGSMIPMTPTR